MKKEGSLERDILKRPWACRLAGLPTLACDLLRLATLATALASSEFFLFPGIFLIPGIFTFEGRSEKVFLEREKVKNDAESGLYT